MASQLRRRRVLRVVISTVCLIACSVCTVMWVRSYWWLDHVIVGNTRISSLEGRLIRNEVFNIGSQELLRSMEKFHFANQSIQGWTVRRGGLVAVDVGKPTPYWVLVAITATLAAVPWIPHRFSLRGLLVVTTIVAMLLALFVAFSR